MKTGVTLNPNLQVVYDYRKKEHCQNNLKTAVKGAAVAGVAYAAPKVVTKLGLGKYLKTGVSLIQKGLGKIANSCGNVVFKHSAPSVGKSNILKTVTKPVVKLTKGVAAYISGALGKLSTMSPKAFAKGAGIAGLVLIGAKLLYDNIKNKGRIDQKYDMVASAVEK